MTKYGIYDTKDNCWIGNEKGPTLYCRKFKGLTPAVLARISAQIQEVRLGFPMGRLEARVFQKKNLRLKDKVIANMTTLEALRRVENEGSSGAPIEIDMTRLKKRARRKLSR